MAGKHCFVTMFALGVMLAAAGAQEAQLYGKTDWGLDGLQGPVKQVISEYWSVGGLGSLGGGGELSLDMKFVTRYDQRGYRVAEEVWVGGQELSYVDLWDYGPEGRLLAKRAQDPEGHETGREEAVWDGKGILVGWISYLSDGGVDRRRVYRYASPGRPAEMTEYRGNGEALLRVAWTWDSAGRMLERLSEEPPGTLLRREVRTYDERGRMLENLFYRGDGLLFSRTVSVYDERGLKIEDRDCDPDGSVVERVEYLYDKNALLAEVRHYGLDGVLRKKSLLVRDAAGNLVDSKTWALGDNAGKLSESLEGHTTYSYEYWK